MSIVNRIGAALTAACLCLAICGFAASEALAKKYDDDDRDDYDKKKEWKDKEWKRHNQRYFGQDRAVEPYPGESYQHYSQRVVEKCRYYWASCTNYCQASLEGPAATTCMVNCNNELYECQSVLK